MFWPRPGRTGSITKADQPQANYRLVSPGHFATLGIPLRRRELAIRVALGAAPRTLVWLALRDGLRPVIWGLAGGIAGALGLAFGMRHLLYGISPYDLPSFGLTPAALAGVALAACWWPARRSARTDPRVALQGD